MSSEPKTSGNDIKGLSYEKMPIMKLMCLYGRNKNLSEFDLS